MRRPKNLLFDGQRSQIQWFRFGEVSFGFVEKRQIVERAGDVGVFGTKHRFPNWHDPQKQCLSANIITLEKINRSQVVESFPNRLMGCPQSLFLNRHRPLEKLRRLVIFTF